MKWGKYGTIKGGRTKYTNQQIPGNQKPGVRELHHSGKIPTVRQEGLRTRFKATVTIPYAMEQLGGKKRERKQHQKERGEKVKGAMKQELGKTSESQTSQKHVGYGFNESEKNALKSAFGPYGGDSCVKSKATVQKKTVRQNVDMESKTHTGLVPVTHLPKGREGGAGHRGKG